MEEDKKSKALWFQMSPNLSADKLWVSEHWLILIIDDKSFWTSRGTVKKELIVY